MRMSGRTSSFLRLVIFINFKRITHEDGARIATVRTTVSTYYCSAVVHIAALCSLTLVASSYKSQSLQFSPKIMHGVAHTVTMQQGERTSSTRGILLGA